MWCRLLSRFGMLCLLVILCGCGGGDGGGDDSGSSDGGDSGGETGGAGLQGDERQSMLTSINDHRAAGATCGSDQRDPVPPVTWSDALAAAAERHSQDMFDNNHFSHTGTDGSAFSQRVKDADYDGSPRGENIAFGYPSVDAVMNGWMNSPGHCKNIMASGSDQVGVARVGSYWTQVFGRKASATEPPVVTGIAILVAD